MASLFFLKVKRGPLLGESGGRAGGGEEIDYPKEKKDNQLTWNFTVSPTWLSFLSFFL